MSTTSLTRVAANTYTAANSFARSTGTAALTQARAQARAHTRVTALAASAATAGVLGAAGFAVGAAPWAQALDNVGHVAQGDGKVAVGQSGAFAFAPITGSKTAGGTTELDALHSAATSSHSTAVALGKHAATVTAPKAPAAQPYVGKHAAAATTTQAAAAKAAAVKAAAAKSAAARVSAAKEAAAKAAAAKAAAAKPYLIYDSVQPGSLPAGEAAAVYATGAYATQPNTVAGHHTVLWIDTQATDPGANVLDVEPGDATPQAAAQWVKQRLTSQPHSIAVVYTMRAEWQQVKDNVATLPGWMQSKVRYWIADPTGVNHVVPGSSATQWYWGSSYDITTANPDFQQ